VRADHHIVGAGRPALLLQPGADLAVMGGGLLGKGQDVQPVGKLIDDRHVPGPPRRFSAP
jgi:hypothetical protein